MTKYRFDFENGYEIACCKTMAEAKETIAYLRENSDVSGALVGVAANGEKLDPKEFEETESAADWHDRRDRRAGRMTP